jgi:hypothetical protein
VDVEATGELRWERTGRKERERTHRGSMENNTEPETGKTQPKYKTIPKRYTSEEREPEMERT